MEPNNVKPQNAAAPVPGTPEIDTGTFAVYVGSAEVAWIHAMKDAAQNGVEYWFYNAGLVTPPAVDAEVDWTLKRVALPAGMPDYATWKVAQPQASATFKKRHRVDVAV